MNNDLIISDLIPIVENKNVISESDEKNKWYYVPFETAEIKGNLIYATHNNFPEPLILNPDVKGIYDIYVGLINLGPSLTSTRTGISVGSKASTSFLVPYAPCWTVSEYIAEEFLYTADLTNEKIIIKKPGYSENFSAICYLKLIPSAIKSMTKTIAYHYDNDYMSWDKYENIKDYTGWTDFIYDYGCEILLHENHLGITERNVNKQSFTMNGAYNYIHNEEKINELIIKNAHDHNVKVYASFRFQAGNFCFPFICQDQNFHVEYFDKHPEYACKTRDGKTLGMLSFAYPEVRKTVISYLIKSTSNNFDGICLFFHRGTFIGFEQPVIDEVKKRYNIDATVLPLSDERLQKVRCKFITQFMIELKSALKENFKNKKHIFVIPYYTVSHSKIFGMDIKEWIDNGLVDEVGQGLMGHFENIDDCIDKNGLVNLEKYKNKRNNDLVISREVTDRSLLIEKGVKEYLEICKNKVQFYATLCWESESPEYMISLIDKLKKMGVTKFLAWNTNEKMRYLSRINVERYYINGNKEEYNKKKTVIKKVISINNIDISEVSPNWKG